MNVAKIYYNMIKANNITIDQVKPKWRAMVEKMLQEDNE